ncbi:virion associated protein [Ralstonia phage RPZH6]|nr:virion associated protein [Ralstonia phage RPZH6]
MAFPASVVLSRAATLLQDEDHERWTVDELLEWLTDGTREIVVRKPSAYMKTTTAALVAGSKQALPEDAIQLIDVPRNLKTDGSPGRAVTATDRRLLDTENPDWHSMKPAGQIRHYTYDSNVPTVFYTYPPAAAGVQVELVCAWRHPALTTQNDVVQMGAEFVSALVSWCLYRASSKDSEFANGAVAAAHYSAFADALGVQATGTPTTQAAAAAAAAGAAQ